MINLTNITIGMTGEQLINAINANYAALNKEKIWNVLNYGVIGDDSTDNTTALQALIEEVKIKGGIIYFPAGIYKTHTLTIYYNTQLIGDGANSSIIKSISAEPLIQSYDYIGWSAPNGSPFGGLNNIKLDGNSVGMIGLHLRMNASLNFNNLMITNFATYGCELNGALIGSFNNCFFAGSPINVYGHKHATTLVDPNLVTFNQCRFYSASKYSLKWEHGALLRLNYCNFEYNGTAGDVTTGSVYYKGHMHGIYYIPSMHMDGCWFEGNEGVNVMLDESGDTNANTHTIERSYIAHDTGGNNRIGVKITGASTHNKLYMRSTVIQGDVPIVGDGSLVHVTAQGCYWDGTPSWLNDATYVNAE
jgi:hypothetical protein